MMSMYAAAMPVADNAIAPTRPPGLPLSQNATPMQRTCQQRAGGHPDLRAKNARLGGEHEQEHHPDERDSDACDGERLADPAVRPRRDRPLGRQRDGGDG